MKRREFIAEQIAFVVHLAREMGIENFPAVRRLADMREALSEQTEPEV